MEEPNYPVIELQAENLKLKDELIQTQKDRIRDLENKVETLEDLLLKKYKDDERDVGSHAIAPPIANTKQHIRTVSEIAARLEQRSINAAKGKLSAEDINEDKTA